MCDTCAERDLQRYFKELESNRPHCEGCDEPITDDVYFEIDGMILCEPCFIEYCDANFKHFFDD